MEKNERNEIKKKQKRDFFARITRKKAKEEILKKQERLGRKLTAEEKHKIIQRVAKQAKNKVLAVVLAGSIGFGAFATVQTTRMLNAGDEDRRPAQEHVLDKTEQESFKESLKVDGQYVDVQVEVSELEAMVQQIESIDSKEDALKFWKNIYVEEYENVTGKKENAGNIKITLSNQSSVYVREDGKRVTRGTYPEGTEAALRADGQAYTSENDVDAFFVELISTGKVLDGMTIKGDAVIDGDNYNELKDNESALVELGPKTTKTSFELARLYEELEQDPSSQYIKAKCENAKNELKEDITNKYENQQDKSVEEER